MSVLSFLKNVKKYKSFKNKHNFASEKCENGKPAQTFMTVIFNGDKENQPEKAKENLLAAGFSVVAYNSSLNSFLSDKNSYRNLTEVLENIESEYFFFANNHFDFDEEHANFDRMIREAENLSADILG